VLSGEATVPMAGAWACCFLVTACELVRDYTRAFEWCDRIDAFARRYGSRYMLGFCRSHYGWLYLCGGRWQEAESALAQAVDAYRASRPTFVPQAIVALAELRRRQGRWQDAERLLDEAGTGGPALLCRARLALDRGEALRAAELAERTLRRVPEHQRLERVPGLELLVRAHAVRGDVASAAAPLQELRSLEQLVPVPSLRALVLLMDGLISAATGDHDAAVRELQDAADQLEQCGAPFEASQARLELARSMIAVGRAEAASQEATIALKRLRQLGADAESRRAQSLLEAATHGVRSARPLPQLTRRERDVLRLVAQGLTNRQIAEQLVVSEHTIHRHITNLLRKLNLPGRTAAATHAALAGLLDTAP
jgi:LuxR family maltose regulon positive regulatory protein